MTTNSELLAKVNEAIGLVRTMPDTLQARADGVFNNLQGILPVAPNLLVDTYQFSTLCGGKVNTEMSAADAHLNSIWSAYLTHNGSVADTKITVLTLDKLKEYGLQPVATDDFSKHVNSHANDAIKPFSGASFRVVLLDINLTTPGGGVGYLHQAIAGNTTGWGFGPEISLFASAMVNVLECTPGLKYAVHANMTLSQCVLSESDIGKGWQYKYGTNKRLGGSYQPWSRGTNLGRIKFAMCLPYVGFGDYGSNFIWVDSIGKASQYKAGLTNPSYSHWHGN